jgi:hypothetical protein
MESSSGTFPNAVMRLQHVRARAEAALLAVWCANCRAVAFGAMIKVASSVLQLTDAAHQDPSWMDTSRSSPCRKRLGQSVDFGKPQTAPPNDGTGAPRAKGPSTPTSTLAVNPYARRAVHSSIMHRLLNSACCSSDITQQQLLVMHCKPHRARQDRFCSFMPCPARQRAVSMMPSSQKVC